MLQEYAYEDWVIAKTGKDRDGRSKKKHNLESCSCTTESARNCASNEKTQLKMTVGFLIAWFGILLYPG